MGSTCNGGFQTMSDKGKCSVCIGTCKNMFNEICTYCNGTGEWNSVGDAYIKTHICQCITWDRKFCPICKKECHHDSSSAPKQVIDSGYGGISNVISNVTSNEEKPEEEAIIA